MNIENLNSMADYLEKGDFGGRSFNMGSYQDCVLGHCAALELKRAGRPMSVETIAETVAGIAVRVFGIKQTAQTEDWTFAFGAQWGSDPKAAASRLRYLALHGGAPDRSVWDLYRSATDEKAVEQYGRCSWQGAIWETENEEQEEELANA